MHFCKDGQGHQFICMVAKGLHGAWMVLDVK